MKSILNTKESPLEYYESLYCNFITIAIVPDISKAFDKVWQRSFLPKLSRCVISEVVYAVIIFFPSGRFMDIVVNGQFSDAH